MTLRVLHAVESLRPEAGSVAIVLPGLLEQLRSIGIESALAAEDLPEGQEPPERLDPTTIPSSAENSGHDGQPVLRGFAAGAGRIDQLVSEVDAVHVHGWGYELALTSSRAARRMGKPYFISPHGALSDSPYTRKNLRARLREWMRAAPLVRDAAAITALNEAEEHELRGRSTNGSVKRLPYGVTMMDYDAEATLPRGHSTVLPSAEPQAGLRPESPHTAPEPPPGRIILMMGPIHPVEGVVPLLKALAELGPEADGWSVVLAGKEVGDWRKMLEAAVRRKGGENRVLFTTAPDQRTQRLWLSRASILASPCMHTRCPVSILQAVSAGVVVLASNSVVPGALENVVQVCAPTRGDIKSGLRRLLAMSDEERARMARDARDSARGLLDWPTLAKDYVRLYEGLRAC